MTLAKFGVKAFSIFVLLASVATSAEASVVSHNYLDLYLRRKLCCAA
jgi:hypothetical protein